MKKYITLAALLAAGAAVANADPTLIAGWNFNNATVDQDGITSFAATSGTSGYTSYTLTGAATAASSADSGVTQSGWASDLTAGGAASTAGSWFVNANSIFSNVAEEGSAFTIMVWAKLPDKGDKIHDTAILGTGTNENWGTGFKWGVTNDNLCFTTKSQTDYPASTTTLNSDTWTHLAISITAKSAGDFDVAYFVNGQAAGTASDPDNDKMQPLGDKSAYFYLGAKGEDGAADKRDTGNFYFDELKIYSGAMTADQVAVAMNDISTVVIPEPSAFGLLAGLGALALVGTRRRRK